MTTSSFSKTYKILVTGAAGNIASHFIPSLCAGYILGSNIEIELRLLELPEKSKQLEALVMELEDCAFKNLKNVEFGVSPKDEERVFKDVDLAIFLGAQTRKPGMERSDLIDINSQIFSSQGKVLNKVANPNCKIVMVANPVNTNTIILQNFCPNIPKQNFTSLNKLDENRAKAQIALKAGCKINEVNKLLIWGNHSLTMYPDITMCTIKNQPILSFIKDKEFLEHDLIEKTKKRGGDVLTAKGHSAVISGFTALAEHLKIWFLGNDSDNEWTTMGVISDGSFYDIPEGLCVAVPVFCKKNLEYDIVRDLQLNETQKEQIKITVQELIEEKEEAFQLIN